jgi:hypothetical protein
MQFDLIEDILLANHVHRRRNSGAADWRVAARGIVVLYDWPHRGDATTAMVQTAWRR